MKEALISIIMNCFNGEKFIEESLRSIVNQKYQNWELIFLDNNSNDSSAKIFKKFKDKRFFYFKNNKTTNISIARNKAISLCNGEYLSFLDVDDYWDEKKLINQIKCFDEKTGVVFTDFWIIKENLKIFKPEYKHKLVNLRFHNSIKKTIIENYEIVQSTIMIKKNILVNSTEIYDEKFHIIGDFILFLKLMNITSIYHLKEPLTYRRIHRNSESRKHMEKTIEEFDTFIKINNSSKHLNKIESNILYKSNMVRKILFLLSKKNYLSSFRLFLKINLIFKYKIFIKIFVILINRIR